MNLLGVMRSGCARSVSDLLEVMGWKDEEGGGGRGERAGFEEWVGSLEGWSTPGRSRTTVQAAIVMVQSVPLGPSC